MTHFDLCIVGAGVVGLAIADTILRSRPSSFSVLLLEKNSSFGQETSSRNSEVIHAGLYYPPGSLKTRLCLEGNALLYDYCRQFDIPHKRIGKLIVAQENELDGLEALMIRARENGVNDLSYLSGNELKEKEPHVHASAAIFSPSTGIIDSHEYMQALLSQALQAGVEYVCHTRVESVRCLTNGFEVLTRCGQDRGEEFRFQCTAFVNAAGLHAQELARNIEGAENVDIPQLQLSKGHYFKLTGAAPFRHLIYPLPEPEQRGLGIHACLDLGGAVRFGPDTERIESIDYCVDSSRRAKFESAIRRYYPDLKSQQLQADYAGIRPKLYSATGAAMDFAISEGGAYGIPGLLQLFGIESPGLTASLAIAKYVERRLP